MICSPRAFLDRLLAGGHFQIGEVAVHRVDTEIELRHWQDAGREDLVTQADPIAARHLANFDAAGEYRPLKTAPTLKGGWRLRLRDTSEVLRALDYFYPAMIGAAAAQKVGSLKVVDLRGLLGRQSGMYAVTRKITDDQAQTMIGRVCTSDGGCLKTILWAIAPGVPIVSLPPAKCDPLASQVPGVPCALPMFCHEACNLLVAEARRVVKGETAAAS